MSARNKIAEIDAKIAKLQAARAELEQQAANEVDTSTLKAGDVVSFEYGRGEKRRTDTGTVLAVKREEGKAGLVRVQVGGGFDAEVLTVFEAAIRSVAAA